MLRAIRNPSASLLALLLVLAAGGASATGVLDAFRRPLEPPGTGGLERLDLSLAKLTGHRRVLVIGAHPDDEDTTLLSLVARGLGGEAAYLSLTRGEGGQNLIGSELGPGLGLLRSRELLAARRVDGARQYFSRAYDFGYTRSLQETLSFWPREVLLEDAVRVIRRFRPQVIVSVFPPDPRAGHGQHQAAGLVAGEAYELAGDPDAFPSLDGEGLPPWRPSALYRNTWWRGRDETTLTESAGRIEPISGRSVFQIAMASRSSHRSQDMGMLQPLGPRDVRLAWEAGGAGPEADDLFAGVDTSLRSVVAGLPGGPGRTAAEAGLDRVEELARRARAELSPADPGAVLPRVQRMVELLREIRGRLPDDGSPGSQHAAVLLDEKVAVAEVALAAAAGVAVDATADREAVAPGGAWEVEAMLWDTGERDDVELLGVDLVSPAGVELAAETAEPEERTGFAAYFVPGDAPERGFHLRALRARVGGGAEPTVPYFLRRPLSGALYDWSAAPADLRGEPFGGPPLVARFRLRVVGVELELDREVAFRFDDQARGEIRHPLRVVPRVEVDLSPDLVVQPVDRGGERTLRVGLTSHADEELVGRLEVNPPAGWRLAGDDAPSFTLAPAGEPGSRHELELVLSPTPALEPGRGRVEVAAVVDGPGGGGRHALAVPLVAYEHVRPTPYPEPAAADVSVADVALPDLHRVGYVRGASDRVPEMLAEIGVPVELLSPEALDEADLSVFDAVVVGSRAYETEPALARANPRLLEYARRGGLLIVQYQQYQFVRGGYAPYPLEIERPHGRVTDETAPVRALRPDHPALRVPNEIGEADWLGWVQERGLYFPATWDEAYTPLLAMRDPDQDSEQRGALLVAELGRGTYVYTGLAFFRQLPAGVPGAYRLFANLLAL